MTCNGVVAKFNGEYVMAFRNDNGVTVGGLFGLSREPLMVPEAD